ncbi:MAG: hypothetical protein Q9217_005191 [Psora testacea]
MELAKRCILFVTEEVAKRNVEACVGIQLVNEASWGAWDEGMGSWYEHVITAVGQVDRSVPLYISDAWDLSRAMQWAAHMNRPERSANPIIVAVPRYYCFTHEDKSQSPVDIVRRVKHEMEDVTAASGSVVDKGAVQVMVVEWSCALDSASWVRYRGHIRDDLLRRFGQIQAEKWREKAGGSYFWTAKAQYILEDWDFPTIVRRGAITTPKNFALRYDEIGFRCGKAVAHKEKEKLGAVDAHIKYWDSTAPDTHFEHWRFDHGWDQGFTDAMDFFQLRAVANKKGECGGDRIGMLELWILKRMREAGQKGPFTWEWEHGFRQGVKCCEALLLD